VGKSFRCTFRDDSRRFEVTLPLPASGPLSDGDDLKVVECGAGLASVKDLGVCSSEDDEEGEEEGERGEEEEEEEGQNQKKRRL
jgi:hypothetical protein